jgi:hypothetical protein
MQSLFAQGSPYFRCKYPRNRNPKRYTMRKRQIFPNGEKGRLRINRFYASPNAQMPTKGKRLEMLTWWFRVQIWQPSCSSWHPLWHFVKKSQNDAVFTILILHSLSLHILRNVFPSNSMFLGLCLCLQTKPRTGSERDYERISEACCNIIIRVMDSGICE